MKKIILTAVLFTAFLFSYGQEKWRTVTFTSLNNVNVTERDEFIPQLSVSLDYEIVKDISISSWNGMAYSTFSDTSWFASQTTLDRRMSNFVIGAGYLYTTSGSNNLFSPVASNDVKQFYVSVKLQYRIKL